MSFVVVQPVITNNRALKAGEVTLTKRGDVSLTVNDCRRHGLTKTAVLLVCKQTNRIAIRAPREVDRGPVEIGMQVRPGHKSPNLRQINIGYALRELGIDAEKKAGRYTFGEKDGLIILSFGLDETA
ncbi:MAG: hypothetical protein AAF842_10645 [Planctomycetota bacterium]